MERRKQMCGLTPISVDKPSLHPSIPVHLQPAISPRTLSSVVSPHSRTQLTMSSLDLTRDWLKTVLRQYQARDRVQAEILDCLAQRRTLSVKTDAFSKLGQRSLPTRNLSSCSFRFGSDCSPHPASRDAADNISRSGVSYPPSPLDTDGIPPRPSAGLCGADQGHGYPEEQGSRTGWKCSPRGG